MSGEVNCSLMSSPVCMSEAELPPEEMVCRAPEPAPVASTPAPAAVSVARSTPARASAEPVSALVQFPDGAMSCEPPVAMSVAPPPGTISADEAGICAPEGTVVPAPAPAPACVPTPGEAVLDVPQQTQVGNSCGTTSLSMVLTYHGAPDAVASVGRVDAAVRPSGTIDSFSAPVDLRNYARDHGFRANLHNDSNPSDLREQIDQGAPPVILIDENRGEGTALHYVVVNGYHQQSDGSYDYAITDPNGFRTTMSEADLNSRWSNLNVHVPVVGGVGTGYNRLMLSVVPQHAGVLRPNCQPTQNGDDVTLPSDNSPGVSNRVAQGANVVVRGVNSAVEVAPKVAPYIFLGPIGGAIYDWVAGD